MTHTQTQGADGAGTITAGATMILLPMDDPSRPLPYSELPPVMIRAGGDAFHRLKRDHSLAADSCSLAVGIYRAMTEAHAKEIATLSPAPAATPGVPDSLREAFAAATDSPVFVHDFADPAVSSAPGCQDVSLSFVTPDHITAAFMGNGLAGTIDQARKDAVALAAAWNHVRALIAAQPAGQAGDAGAETERLREAVSKALHDNQFLDGWPEMVDPVVEAVLAARPEAPSDAGWSQAARDVLAERRRQVAAEGYSFEHDDNHARGELAAAAACYALPLAVYTGCLAPFPPRGTLGLKLANHVWPWAPGSFRRKSRREDLIRAAALLIAEVERLDRLEVRGK